MNPGNVMDRIEDVFGKLDMIKGSRKSNIVKILIKGRLTTRMTNHYLGLICEFNPNLVDLAGIPRQYDMWIFFRYNNKDLMRDMGSGTFVLPVVTTIQVASQPFIAPQPERGTELILQD